MRGFDFDAEAAVRLSWRGVEPIKIPAPVRYFRPSEGGVSHFNYWRDNALLDLDAPAAAAVGLFAALAVAGGATCAPPATAPPGDLVAAPADTYIMGSSTYMCP